ncbi:MAG: hypothetical protein RR954_07935 [Christensenellaceae bacterium]
MKFVSIISLVMVIGLAFSSCHIKNEQVNSDNTTSISHLENPEDGNSSSVSEQSEEVADENSIFTLGNNVDTKAILKKGDTFGEWKVSNIECEYDENGKLKMLTAKFIGDVILTGTVKRNGMLDNAYDFIVSDTDFKKMPHFNHSDCNTKNGSMFIMNFSDEIENALNMDFDEEVKCTITVSDYHFIFAYMTAPAHGTVQEIIFD